MKAIKDLTKEELITLVYNNELSNTDIFTPQCECFVCGTRMREAKYGYECASCQKENEDWHTDLKKNKYE